MQNDSVLAEHSEEGSACKVFVPFSNSLMFNYVLKTYPDLCKEVIEAVLDIEIQAIEFLEIEHTLQPTTKSKGARLDVLVKTKDALYDVEMQVKAEPFIGKRMRYYQDSLDVSLLKKGSEYQYSDLLASYIIFFCLEDPYDLSYPIYPFKTLCTTNTSLEAGDDITKIVLNASAWEKLDEGTLRDLLCYLKTAKAGSASLVQQINDAVVEENESEGVVDMLTIEERYKSMVYNESKLAREKGRAEGEAIGRAEGENIMSSLMSLLLKEERYEDAQKATSDPEYRAQLFRKYGLI